MAKLSPSVETSEGYVQFRVNRLNKFKKCSEFNFFQLLFSAMQAAKIYK